MNHVIPNIGVRVLSKQITITSVVIFISLLKNESIIEQIFPKRIVQNFFSSSFPKYKPTFP